MKTFTAGQKYCLVFLLVLLPIGNFALAEQAIPEFTGRVIDLTDTLTSEQRRKLEQRLKRLEEEKGSQLAVLIVPSTQSESIEQYSIRVVEKWRLGRKDIDDGVLLLIAKNDRRLCIEVGYGLEGAIPDVTAKRVIREIITPHFKKGDFYGGITAGVEQLARLIQGEPLPEPEPRQTQRNRDSGDLLFWLFFILFFAPTFRWLFGRLPGALAVGGIAGFLTWSVTAVLMPALFAGVVLFFLALVFGTGGRGHYTAGHGGPWTGGWSGPGGFPDGGGGGFGGGGALGNW